MVEVVNIRNCSPVWGQPGDVRIDRTSKWGNPFYMHDESERDYVCEKYIEWFRLQKKLDIRALKDVKRLGCWCKPKRCHGDFLKQIIEGLDK
jgi:hypothetical protein